MRYTFISDGYAAVKSDVCYEDQNEDYCGDAIDKLAAYEDAEEQGLLMRLPKTLYEADTTPLITGVIEWQVIGVQYCDGTVQAYAVQTKNVQGIIYEDEIGKTVFLHREEAEAAMKREQNK